MSLIDQSSKRLERLLLAQVSRNEVQDFVKKYAQPYRKLMADYRCAMMEVSTKFDVLNEELSLQYDRNPIETIKTRLKSPESILGKTKRKGIDLTVDAIEKNIYDIAGVRVICSFPSDIYMMADALLKQDDIWLIKEKDYIKQPKDNGYRSLHLIVETPIFLHDEKKLMKVEVQLRTIAMDFWASLEHKLKYKKDIVSDQLTADLKLCADESAALDLKMDRIRKEIEVLKTLPAKAEDGKSQ